MLILTLLGHLSKMHGFKSIQREYVRYELFLISTERSDRLLARKLAALKSGVG